MSLPEREGRPLYGNQLWIKDPKTGERRRWLGDESNGVEEGDEEGESFPKKDSLEKLEELEIGSVWPFSRINDDS